MSLKLSGKTEGSSLRPTKYDIMRMKMADKKLKTTSRRIMIPKEIIEDCLSSWLTATREIEKFEFVTGVYAHYSSDNVGIPSEYEIEVLNG